MSTIDVTLKEMDNEATTTRKMLERVPDDKFTWKPHEKSMSVEHLTTHIAELPGWVSMVLTTSELDFAANPYERRKSISKTKDLINLFEETLQMARPIYQKQQRKTFNQTGRFESDQVYSVNTEGSSDPDHLLPDRTSPGSSGVYLRLLNAPISGSYGPSADEMNF